MANWLTVLNEITPLLAFLGTVIIGGFATYIAHRQWRTNKDKLKLDLYDRRYAIYDAAIKFVWALSGNAMMDAKSTHEFHIATRQAPFLFDDASIPEYFKTLIREAQRLEIANSHITNQERMRMGQQNLEIMEAANTKLKICQWFLEQEKVIQEKFDPYLKLRG